MLLYRGGAASETDRQAIIEAIAIAEHPELLIEMTRSEKSPELRARAIHGLGMMDSEETGEALVTIYKQNSDVKTREAVVQAFMMQDNVAAVLEVVRTEQNPDLRRAAIHALGAMDEHDTGDELVQLYRRFTDRDTRRAVLDAFMMQDNAEALITIAREEKDPELRREAISRLANVDSDEATEFLLKILEEE
jgi:HEAT repeat protein